MALPHQPRSLSEQDYLRSEEASPTKHEYIDGDVYAMAGASKNHDKIAGNVFAKLHAHLENSPCTVFSSDMKIKAGADFFLPRRHGGAQRRNGP